MMLRNLYSLTAACALFGLVACAPASDELGRLAGPQSFDRTDDVVVATVDGSPIYRSDVRRAAEAGGQIGPDETLRLDEPVFLVTVGELIDQRLLALDARRTGVAVEEEVQRRLAEARERILGNYRVEARLAEAVTDDTVLELYQTQREMAGRGEERRIRQIVVGDEETANTVLSRLQDEEDFAELVAEYSTDESTRENEGERGWVSRDMLGGTLRTAVFNAELGGRTGPIEVDGEWVIIEVLDTRTPSNRSFEEVREEIERFLTFQTVEGLMTELRENGEIERLYEDMEDEPETDEAETAAPDTEDAGE